MNRELIKLEMSRHYWAITEDALNGIVDFVYSDADMSPESFHRELDKPTAYFGEPVKGTYYSYKNGDIGIMMIDGPIIPRATFLSKASGSASVDVMSDEFKALQADPSVREIVLLLDTPGGAVTGISDFSALIRSGSKPTDSFAWMAASAGYEIASATRRIYMPPTGIGGSIGTQITSTDRTMEMEKKGIRQMRVISKQSPNKNAGLDTENGLSAAQLLANDLADVFIESVAIGRGVSKETVEKTFGGGAMFAAARAKEVGMIDEIMDFQSFINMKTSKTQPKQLFGFSTNNTKENQMSDENKVVEADATVAPVVNAKDIAKAERERIQSIESLASMAEGKHPSIVAAVRGTIDSVKFEDGMDKAKAEIHVLKSISAAQEKLITELEADHRNVNQVAEHVSSANAEEQKTKTQAEYDAKTNELVTAAQEANKLKGR